MKKKILSMLLAVVMVLGVVFTAAACGDGKSAYELWLAEGNVGTEQQYLDSLKGEKGDQGIPGLKGDEGEQGPAGPTGPAGPVGAAGKTWHKGETDPTADIGVEGDLYLNTDTFEVWEKGPANWTSQGTITGADGATWHSGAGLPTASVPANAKNGDFYLNTTDGNVYKRGATTWDTTNVVITIKGSNGTNGADGATWHSGAGLPTASVPANAKNGDFYLNTTDGKVYKRVSGAWDVNNVIVTIKGSNGIDGATWYAGDGTGMPTGKNGDFYLNTTNWNVYKNVSGTWDTTTVICNLKGGTGGNGLSAYQLAQAAGFEGTVTEWLASLAAKDGLSAYEIAKELAEEDIGSIEDWLLSLKGKDGKSAYEIAQANGFEGSEEEWLESLKGATGNGIVSIIEIDDEDDNDKTHKYEITYSNGDKDYITINDGADGDDFDGDSRLIALEAAVEALYNYNDTDLVNQIESINEWIDDVIEDYSEAIAAKQQQIEHLQEQINFLNSELENTVGNVNDHINAVAAALELEISLKQEQIAYLNAELIETNRVNAEFRDWAYNKLLALQENANPVVDIYVGFATYGGSNVQSYFDVLFSGKIKEVSLDYYYVNENDQLVHIASEDSNGMVVAEGVDVTWGDAEYAYFNDKDRVIGYGNGFNVGGNYFDRITDGHYTFANYFKVVDTAKSSIVYFTVKTDVKNYVYKITWTGIGTPVNNYEYAPATPEFITYAENIGGGLLSAWLDGYNSTTGKSEGMTFAQFKDAYTTAQTIKDVVPINLRTATPKSTSGIPSVYNLTTDVWAGLEEYTNATFEYVDYEIGQNAKEIIDGKGHTIYNTTFTVAHNAELTIRNATIVYYVEGVNYDGIRTGGQTTFFLVNATGKLTLENVTIIVKPGVTTDPGSPVIYIKQGGTADAQLVLNDVSLTCVNTDYWRPVYVHGGVVAYPFVIHESDAPGYDAIKAKILENVTGMIKEQTHDAFGAKTYVMDADGDDYWYHECKNCGEIVTTEFANEQTLPGLIELAVDGDTISIERDTTVAPNVNGVTINQDITLDLGGNTLMGRVALNANATLKNGTIIADTTTRAYGVMLGEAAFNFDITIQNIVSSGYYSGFYTNGTVKNNGSRVTVTECTFTSITEQIDTATPLRWTQPRRAAGAYLAGNHEISFTDTIFDGGTGAHIKSGTYTFENCIFDANAPEFINPVFWNDGGVATGSALYLEHCTPTYGPIGAITVKNCEFNSEMGFGIESVANNPVEWVAFEANVTLIGDNEYDVELCDLSWVHEEFDADFLCEKCGTHMPYSTDFDNLIFNGSIVIPGVDITIEGNTVKITYSADVDFSELNQTPGDGTPPSNPNALYIGVLFNHPTHTGWDTWANTNMNSTVQPPQNYHDDDPGWYVWLKIGERADAESEYVPSAAYTNSNYFYYWNEDGKAVAVYKMDVILEVLPE